jgi:hypothetical protein
MSFRCGSCGKVATKGEMVVLETRHKQYSEKRKDEYGKERTVVTGQGQEIVREERWCEACRG